METIRLPRVMQDTALKEKLRARSIGFVPTMGALHEGHMCLFRTARQENDIVIASIFVNPAQFGPGEDFGSYPRPLGADMERLEAAGADYLFLPEPAAMYPEGFSTGVTVKGLSGKMCGLFRPGHFEGVATVVVKLFNLTRPTNAYFGQKDYQQSLIIRQLVKDLNIPTSITVCPTLREPDGLAMSSRNRYLSEDERKAAPVLFRALQLGAEEVRAGRVEAAAIRGIMAGAVKAEPLVTGIDYLSAFDPDNLEEPEIIQKNSVLLAGAVRLGATRIIDNVLVNDLK